MLKNLSLINFPSSWTLPLPQSAEVFSLQTCQRKLVIGFHGKPLKLLNTLNQTEIQHIEGVDAYQFLLETICGLKSKVLGETEIVSQFKTSYSEYLNYNDKNPYIMKILEKLFKDAKDIRCKYLMSLNTDSYSGIARRLIMQAKKSAKESNIARTKKILITGSGALAEDLIKILKNKFDIYLTARNSEKVGLLVEKYGVNPLPWRDYQLYEEFSQIINTIGADEVLFGDKFFKIINEHHTLPIFIDLGEPSVIKTTLTATEGVYRLNDIFEAGQTFCKQKDAQINLAREYIIEVADKRKSTFAIQFPFGWEDLQFN